MAKQQHIQELQESIKLLTRCLLQSDNDYTNIYRTVIEIIEVPILEEVMKFTGSNQSQTAQLLGLNRATVRDRLHRHNLI